MGKSGLFLYPDGDPDHSQNLMGAKLDQDLSSDFFMQLCNPANRQMVLEIIPPCQEGKYTPTKGKQERKNGEGTGNSMVWNKVPNG